MRKELKENNESCIRINISNIYRDDPTADFNELADLYTKKGAQVSSDRNNKGDVIMVICGLSNNIVYKILDDFLLDGFDVEFNGEYIDNNVKEGRGYNGESEEKHVIKRHSAEFDEIKRNYPRRNHDCYKNDLEECGIPAYEDVDISECNVNENDEFDDEDADYNDVLNILQQLVDDNMIRPTDDIEDNVFEIMEQLNINPNDLEDDDYDYWHDLIIDAWEDVDFSEQVDDIDDFNDDYVERPQKIKRAHRMDEKKKGCCPNNKKSNKLFESLKAQDAKEQGKVSKSEEIVKMVLKDIESTTYGEHEAIEALKKLKAENNKLRKIKGENGEMLSIADIKGTKKALKTLSDINAKTTEEVSKFEASLSAKVQECLKNNKNCLHENVRINGKSLKDYSINELKDIYKKVCESKKALTLKLKNNLNESVDMDNIKENLNRKNQLLEYLDEEITYRVTRAKFLNEDDNTLSDEELQNMFGPAQGEDNKENDDEEKDTEKEESDKNQDEEAEEVELAKIVITLKDADALEALKQACLDAEIPEDAFEVEGIDNEEDKEKSEDEEESEESEESEDEEKEENESYHYSNIKKLLFEAEESEESEDEEKEDESEDEEKEDSEEKSEEDTEDEKKEDSDIKFILVDTDYAEALADVLDKQYGITKEEFEEMIGGEIVHEEESEEEAEEESKEEEKEEKEESKDEEKSDDKDEEVDPSELFKGL